MQVLPADYSFRDLYDWKVRLGQLSSYDALIGYAIDQDANRITIDLRNFADTSTVKAAVSSLDIPIDAIKFRHSNDAGPFAYLYDSIDPAVGGIAIEALSQDFQCTIGFNARATYGTGKWHRIFFTADHCTRGFDDIGDRFFQPERPLQGTRELGTEVYSTKPSLLGCGSNCFDGDVAIVEYDSLEQYRRGVIPSGFTSLGTAAVPWDETSIWEVNGVITAPTQGLPARKIGIATGYTYGNITHTCYNYTGAGPQVNCLIEVTRPSGITWSIAEPGDSGAPVFFRPYSNYAYALGILFGGTGEAGQQGVVRFWATPISVAMNGPGMPGGTFDFTYNGLVE